MAAQSTVFALRKSAAIPDRGIGAVKASRVTMAAQPGKGGTIPATAPVSEAAKTDEAARRRIGVRTATMLAHPVQR